MGCIGKNMKQNDNMLVIDLQSRGPILRGINPCEHETIIVWKPLFTLQGHFGSIHPNKLQFFLPFGCVFSDENTITHFFCPEGHFSGICVVFSEKSCS